MQWREIRDGIRAVGILEMEIYILDTSLFMIVETPLDFDWDEAMARLATLPRQAEWGGDGSSLSALSTRLHLFREMETDASHLPPL